MANRREFIRLVLGSAGILALSRIFADQVSGLMRSVLEVRVSVAQGVRYGMVIDTRACIGCRRCVYACIKENNIDRDSNIQWIIIFAMKHGSISINDAEYDYKKAPRPDRWYLPVQCMHCGYPPCVEVCPVKATWKAEDGIVVIDYNRCIGCRYCISACPYWARHFNAKRPYVPPEEINPEGGTYQDTTYHDPIRPMGVVEKCTFCAHRVRKGIEPKCVEVCPVGARHFGDLNDPDSVVSKMIRTRRVFRLKEELNTDPQIYYVG